MKKLDEKVFFIYELHAKLFLLKDFLRNLKKKAYGNIQSKLMKYFHGSGQTLSCT